MNLNKTRIRDEGMVYVGKIVGELKNLTRLTLNLTENRFGSHGVHDFFGRLQNLEKLTYLDLNFR